MKITTTLLATLILGTVAVAFAEDPKPAAPVVTTCIVSGEALDSMGKPYVFTYEGQEIQLCCKDCKKEFDANPAKFLKKDKAPKTE